jgi:hypothetical protein
LNLSSNGTNSTLIRDWYDRSMDMGPDLVILYMGNNEGATFSPVNPFEHPTLYRLFRFIRFHSRVYSAANGMIEINRNAIYGAAFLSLAGFSGIKTALQPESKRSRVDEVYAANLKYMISLALQKGAHVMVVNTAANIRDWPPIKSFHYTPLDRASLSEFASDMDKARSALAANKFDEAGGGGGSPRRGARPGPEIRRGPLPLRQSPGA